MSIKVNIHSLQRHYTNGQAVVDVQGDTVGECLKDLVKQHPGIEKEIFSEKGDLNPVVEVYVNAESAYPEELAMKVKDGDAISLTLLIEEV